MKRGICIAIAAAALTLLCGYLFFSQYTGLFVMNEVVSRNWADLDAQLQSREDLIPDLVSTVKDRIPDEEDVFTGITDARGKGRSRRSPDGRSRSTARRRK